MPTKHPRHSVTETPRLRAALDELRRRGVDFTLSDLAVRGAQARVAELEHEQRRRALRRRLAQAVRDGDHGLDPAALDDVRKRGWTRHS